MNCFRKSKSEKSTSCTSANGNQRSASKRERLYKKKSERSSAGTTETKTEMDGHGSSKGRTTIPFCWNKTPDDISPSTEYGTALPKVAYMPVSKNDPFYNMNHPRRGKAAIFNFDHWDNTTIPELELKPRKGSQKDHADLTECLENLDFEVATHNNCDHREMWKILDDLQGEDHSDADCLVVAVFTHGERNTFFVRDGVQIPVNLIWEHFEAHACPSLAGKPKIFIIQACRGRKYDSGTTLAQQIRQGGRALQSMDETDSATFSYVIPNAADILVAFSCPLGHYSWRHPERGSWFIQSICKIFNENAYTMDLQNLFTTVAREVALNYESYTDEWETNKKKQVPSTCSTLIRSCIFTPKLCVNHDQLDNGVANLEEAVGLIQVTEEKAESEFKDVNGTTSILIVNSALIHDESVEAEVTNL